MYISTHSEAKGPIKAHRDPKDPGHIWLKVGYDFTARLPLNEAQQLIAELQRELAVVEAAARGAVA